MLSTIDHISLVMKKGPVAVPSVRRAFAKRLRLLRTMKGFDTTRDFARALGIEEDRYTRWERAETEPGLESIMRMCQILRVTPNDLFLPLKQPTAE